MKKSLHSKPTLIPIPQFSGVLIISLLLFALILLTPWNVKAQKPIDSLSFATDGNVLTAQIHQNTLYIGGSFKNIGKKTGSLAYFPNGSSMPDYSFPVFGPINLTITRKVTSVETDGQGGWFVGGYFEKVNNRPHPYLVHLLPNKEIDESFSFPIAGNTNNGHVNVLKRDGNYLYIGGQFSFSKDGDEYANILRLDIQSMQIDASWNPHLTTTEKEYIDQIEISNDKVILAGIIGGVINGVQRGGFLVLDKNSGHCLVYPSTMNTDYPKIHLMGDTLVIGKFGVETHGFGYRTRGLALFDEDYKRATDSTLIGVFYASAPDGNGGFYVCGKVPGNTGVFHLDRNLKPVPGFSQTQINKFDILSAHILLGNNSLYVSSSDGYSSGSVTVNGNSIKTLFKLNATTGEIDPAFKPNPNGKVFATLLKGDTLFVAGSFSTIGNVQRTGLAALNANTGEVYDWDPSFDDNEGFYLGLGNHHVSTLKMIHDTLYAAGNFITKSTGENNISSLVRYDLSSGNLDTTFHLATSRYNLPEFTSMELKNNTLYLVGDFEIDNGDTLVKNVGKLNLNTKQLLPLSTDLKFTILTHIYALGKPKIIEKKSVLYISGYDTRQLSTGDVRFFMASLNESTLNFTKNDMGVSGPVYTMASDGGRVMLSGNFSFIKWYPYNLMGININTKAYVPFPPILILNHGLGMVSTDQYLYLGIGLKKFGDSTVNGLVRLKRKDLSITHFNHRINNNDAPFYIDNMTMGKQGLYVAGFYNPWSDDPSISSGAFHSVAGQPRQNICLLDPETAALKSWNPPHYNAGSCKVFAFGNDVFLAGDFNMMPAYQRSNLAKIDLNTKSITDWAPMVGDYFAYVNTLLVSSDTVFVGGSEISKVNDKDAGNLFAISTQTGQLYDGFTPPAINGEVSALYHSGSKLYATGGFSTVGAVSHNHISRFNSADGSVDAWDPQLEGSWNMGVSSILVDDTSVFLAGAGLGVSGGSQHGTMLRVTKASAALQKVYPGGHYDRISSLSQNEHGDVVAGMLTNTSDDLFFYRLDKNRDSLMAINETPKFSGIEKIKPIGNYFLVAGNQMKEFGSTTEKPGLFVYDPVEDTITASFSTPLVEGVINTFAADDRTLVFAGNFGGMNGDLHNADVAFMHTPDLQLQPGISSWSPKVANNKDPFAISIYGNGFTQNTRLSLIRGTTERQPDSMNINNRKVTAYFNGANFTVAQWDLKVVINPDTSLLFSKAIDIKNGKTAEVWANWTGPANVLANKPTTFYLNYGNQGSGAAYGVFLYLGVGSNQLVDVSGFASHLNMPFEVNWDTIPQFVNVDYFLGEPFHGKVYTLFIPYIPANFVSAFKLKITSVTSETVTNEIKYAISKPLFENFDEMIQTTKSTSGTVYNFFRCAYDVVGIVADLTPGVGCIKSFFDNTVVAGADKYMNNESVDVYDVTNSVGMIALGCVPGGAEMGAAVKISKEMVEMGADVSGAFSSCKKLVDDDKKDSKNIKSLFSHDPNAKYGPTGRGSSIYMPTHQPYQYMVTFENDSAATAPAQRVVITDTLDRNVFDISTFKPIGFGFGDTTYFYKETDGDTVDIDLRPHKNAIVRVFYQLDRSTGILTWKFLTLDPNTYQLTDEVYDGFLPPNHTPPEGEGNVLYSISPLTSLPDNTFINNSAHIVFDWNTSIPTDQWHNATDNTIPESAVNPLPAKTVDKNFTVSWKGHDKSSGIFSYTIFVAENDSAYYPWLLDTHDTTAIFSGQPGSTYQFYSVATDSAGNQEAAPTLYDAITQVSGTGIDTFGTGNGLEFKIYPNPARGKKVNLDIYLPEKSKIRIDILNVCGHLAKDSYRFSKTSGRKRINVDLTQLPAGYYFVRILTKYGVQTRKLVVQ